MITSRASGTDAALVDALVLEAARDATRSDGRWDQTDVIERLQSQRARRAHPEWVARWPKRLTWADMIDSFIRLTERGEVVREIHGCRIVAPRRTEEVRR